MHQSYQSQFNKPQYAAIEAACQDIPFVLLQGPPGTGKTYTILGIVSALLAHEPEKRVLVCAPSNAAVDEVASRLSLGIISAEGLVTQTKVCRVGDPSRIDERVASISLDVLVKKRASLSSFATRNQQSKKMTAIVHTIDATKKMKKNTWTQIVEVRRALV